jgi:hypothetical protein
MAVEWQIGPWRWAHQLVVLDSGINLVPSKLSDESVVPLSGDRITSYGFSLQLPWKDVYLRKSYDSTIVSSTSGGGSLIISDPSSVTVAKMDAAMLLGAKGLPGLQKEPLGSNYGLLTAALSTRVDEVKWWKTHNQNIRYTTLLWMKFVAQMQCEGVPIPYIANYGAVRGFQFGDPRVSSSCVKLDLYDSGNQHYVILIHTPGDRRGVNQAEVNAMVASLRPIGAN